jgi:hypothetical protein
MITPGTALIGPRKHALAHLEAVDDFPLDARPARQAARR